MAAWLRDICHREDPTRPVTAEWTRWHVRSKNGFAAALDVARLNYIALTSTTKPTIMLPQRVVLGSGDGIGGKFAWSIQMACRDFRAQYYVSHDHSACL